MLFYGALAAAHRDSGFGFREVADKSEKHGVPLPVGQAAKGCDEVCAILEMSR